MYGEGAWERATNPVPFVPGCRPLIYFSIWDKVRVTELYSTSTISVLTAYKHPVSLSSAYLHNNPRLYIRNITKHKNTENTKFVYTKIWVHLVLWFIMIYWNEPRLSVQNSLLQYFFEKLLSKLFILALIFSKVSSKKAFWRTNRGIRNLLFWSEIVTFHLFVIIGLAGCLPDWVLLAWALH